uniref:Uncharacterized protein n=1 Tax=Anguilla anguilla TaxID=7936 RepID=A0A0E9RKW2_ANGAN
MCKFFILFLVFGLVSDCHKLLTMTGGVQFLHFLTMQ